MERWIGKISIADFFTLANALLGFLAITYIIDAKFYVAYLCLFGAIVIDGLDGRIARYFESKHHFGPFFDSFSDVISFCFAPGILLYSNIYDSTKGTPSLDNMLAIAVPAFFICFGIMRLARFTAVDHKEKNFHGLPTPAATYMVIILCILFGRNALIFRQDIFVMSLSFVVALVMIGEVPYPKIGSRFFIPAGISVFFAIIATIILMIYIVNQYATILAILAFAFILAYFIGGPLYIRFSKKRLGQAGAERVKAQRR